MPGTIFTQPTTIVNPAEQLLADARQAAHSGQRSWVPLQPAVDLYRAKNWKWPSIWKRMTELGIVTVGDVPAYHSFRSAMSRRERVAKQKAIAAQ